MSKTSSLRCRNASRSVNLQGSKISLPKEYGGLGKLYFSQLGQEPNKILQVDTVTAVTETKGTVKGRSIQLALEMKKRGVAQNDIVVISSRNHANQTTVVLASLFLGAIIAPLDPEFSYSECLELIKKLKPKMCFGDTRTISQLGRIISNVKFNSQLIHFGTTNGGATPFSKLFVQKEDEQFQPVYIDNPKSTVAFILPTQGTSNMPKLICLSHQNIYVQTKTLLEIFGYPDKVLSFFPLSWVLQTVLTCASFEATVVRILPGAFSERNACKIIQDFGVEHAIFGTDYAMRIISNVAIKDFDLNCLKCVLIGAVNTTKHDIHQLKTLLPHVKFLQCYCLTETGCIAATSITNYSSSLEKPESVGRLSMNCKIKIIDFDTRESLGPDNYGELYFHGDAMMLGYFKETEKTLASLEKGFFKTGDMAMYDEDGWIYIKGRIEDLIVMDNYRLCPNELEDIILAHPFVKDVVVIGNQKQIVACIVKNSDNVLTEEKLLKYISERVPESNTPTKIVFMDSFPRTSIGTVTKRLLREDLLQVKIGYTTSLASISTS